VIVSEQVKEAVKREHTQLGLIRVAGVFRLLARGTAGNDDVAEEGAVRGIRGKRQDVGRPIFPPVL